MSKYLSFLPEVGIKSAWIYQHRKTSYFQQAPNPAKVFSGNDNFNGVGPKADLKAKWYFGKNFSLIGGVDVALLFASNRTSYNQTCLSTVGAPADGPYSSTYAISNHLKKNHVSPFLGLNIGFAYDTNFMDDAFNFGIKVAYEQLYYNKASRIMYSDTASFRDLAFQGVDIGLEFSF
ncbi:hypothetical protein EBR43_13615 [bacterium]|nr:hypothetical protein [bacterium]